MNRTEVTVVTFLAVLVTAVFLADIYFFAGVLPAIPYIAPALIGALIFPPRIVAGIVAYSLTLELLGAGLQRSTVTWLSFLYPAGGAIIGVFAVALATHKREAMLKKVAEVERRRLDAVLRQAPVGIMIAEAPSGRVVLGNKQIQRIWRNGLVAANIEQYREYKGFHPDGRPCEPEEWPIARSIRSGETVTEEEMIFVGDDGTRSIASVSSAPILDDEGRIVAGVMMFAVIAERRRAEEERKTVLRTAMDGFWIVDTQGRFLEVNEAYCCLIGYSRDELLAMRIKDVDAVESQEEIARHIQRVMQAGRDRFETRHRRKDGRIVDIEVSVNYLESDGGRLFAFLRDITQRKRAGQFRREYISLISHDLRGPLTPIAGMAQWLYRRLLEEGREADAKKAETIVKSARRLTAMLTDLTDSALLETDRIELRKEPTDLAHLVSDVAERAVTLEDRPRVRVEVREPVPSVMADADRIERAIANLLSNALKYSSVDTPVIVRLERHGDEVLISVTDQGIGISPEDVPHIFQRHYRAKVAKKTEGLGLGLYIVRLIVEAHGGRVWVESEVGKGSTFHLALRSRNETPVSINN